MQQHKPLSSQPITAGAALARPGGEPPPRITLDAPALTVMTDLTRVDAATIGMHESMDAANQTMIRLGIRLLFVNGSDGGFAGLITATDILGEKPMRLVQERGVRHSEIQVVDLMTPVGMLDALTFHDVRHASVGNVVATLKLAGRQHTLVIDSDGGGAQSVRGIFSASQISRQLGMPVDTSAAAMTFSALVTELS